MSSKKTIDLATEETDITEIRSQIQRKLSAPEKQACLETVEFILGERSDNFTDFSNIEQNLPQSAVPVDFDTEEQSLEEALRELQRRPERTVYEQERANALITLNRYVLLPDGDDLLEAALDAQHEAIENDYSLVTTHPSEY